MDFQGQCTACAGIAAGRLGTVGDYVGGGRYYCICNDVRYAYALAARNVAAAGMSLFVSAGNDGHCNSLSAPARISHLISVGAVYDADIGRNPPEGYVVCIKNGSCVGTFGLPC